MPEQLIGHFVPFGTKLRDGARQIDRVPIDDCSWTRMRRSIKRFRHPRCRSGGGEPGNRASLLARCSTRIRRNGMFLTKMPHSGQTGSGWRDPSLATAVKPRPAPVTRHPPLDRRAGCRRADRTSFPQTAFRRAPSGASPVVRYLHKATSSFRARATAVILRIRPRAEPTRSTNQRASALSGW